MRDTFNANKFASISEFTEYSKNIPVSYLLGKMNFFKGSNHCPHIANNDDFISDISDILNAALTNYPIFLFYIMGDNFYDFFLINSNDRCLKFYLFFTSLCFCFPR